MITTNNHEQQPVLDQRDKFVQRTFGRNISNLPQKLPAVLFSKKPDSLEYAKPQPKCDLNESSSNPQECGEYAEEIETHVRNLEGKYMAKYNYMAKQSDISEKMRAILIDWMVDVHLKFKLSQEVLFLSVNLIDRFLEKEMVARQKLQLVGVTAMLIASKYDEIYPPEIKDFVYISDNAYTKKDIILMEQRMLKVLNFELNAPSCYRFLQRYSKKLVLGARAYNMALYLIELSLVEYRFLRHRPSLCAAAALYLCNRLINKDTAWDTKLGDSIGYKAATLKQCAKELAAIMQAANTSTLQAVKHKYSLPIYTEVSAIKLGKRSQPGYTKSCCC